MLGFDVKHSKEQPPDHDRKVQGVLLQFGKDRIQVAPTPQRAAKMLQAIATCLQNNTLAPHDAAGMAGKLVFLSTIIFGRVGRAATKPIYGRQYAKCPNRTLTKSIRDALLTLQHVLQTAPPRHIQWSMTQPLCNFLYADAFFDMGDRRFKPSSTDIPTDWRPTEAHLLHNGWGVVFFPRKHGWPQAITMRGEVPPHILQKYCQRQAFI